MLPYGSRFKIPSPGYRGNKKPIHGKGCVICYPPQKPEVAKGGKKKARREAKKELVNY